MDRFDQIRRVFEDVCDLEAGARERALADHCGADAELRREVEALLESADDSAELEPGTERSLALDEPELAPDLEGTKIGEYQIVRRIGSGGMSIVFEAEQDDPRRRVALKMLKLGFDTPDAQRRFRYEAEILARLRHPGIAQIYASGVHAERVAPRDREVPWFAMEYVEGAQSIVRFVEHEGLDIEARVRLFLRVCDAVAHGHQRGVIHRDLKPDNILVDAEGHPKIIDFGIARTTGADQAPTEQLTQVGQVIGTLRYMSPEQLIGDPEAIDTRSDVYALGVVLYELLTGRLPHDFDSKPMVEVMRMIQEDAPVRPSQRNPALSRDLELIISTAIAQDPARRFGSPADLAADLRRFLDHEPIQARTPTWSYQVRMFTRRHRALVGAVILIVLASIAAAIISLDYAAETRSALKVSETQRQRASELFESSLDFSMDFLREFYTRLEPIDGTLELRTEMLADVLAQLQHLEELAEQGEDVRDSLADAYCYLGDVQGNPAASNAGDFEAARASFSRAFELATTFHADHPDDRTAWDALARARLRMADIAFHLDGRLETARDLYLGYLELQERLDHDRGISIAYSRLALMYSSRDDIEKAIEYEDKNREVVAHLMEEDPGDGETLHSLGLSYGRFSAMQSKRGDVRGAIESLGKALEIQEELFGRWPEKRRFAYTVGQTCVHLGNYHGRLGEWELAEPHLHRGLEVFEKLVEQDPEEQKGRVMMGLAHFELGNFYGRQALEDGTKQALGLHERALAAFHEALRIWEALDSEGKLSPPNRPIVQEARKRLSAHQKWIEHIDR